MPTNPKIARGNSSWHLLFPLNASEEMISKDGSKKIIKWDGARLKAIVDNRNALDRHTERYGSRRQPWPVSLHHGIERRTFFGEDIPAELLQRMGSGWALWFHDAAKNPVISEGGNPAPSGLYALIEWSTAGSSRVQWGEAIVLSPTTHANAVSTDGTKFGETIVAVGLVDEAKLDFIGTVFDGLDALAFGDEALKSVEFIESSGRELGDENWYLRNANKTAKRNLEMSDVIMRSALHCEDGMDGIEAKAKANTKADETEIVDEEVDTMAKGENPFAKNDEKAEVETKAEPSILEGALKTLTAHVLECKAMLAKIGAVKKAEKIAEEDEDDAELMQKSRQANAKRARDIIMRHVEAGELFGETNIRTARARLMNGEEIADLILRRNTSEPRATGEVSKNTKAADAEHVSMRRVTFEELDAIAQKKAEDENGVVNIVKYGEIYDVELRAARADKNVQLVEA